MNNCKSIIKLLNMFDMEAWITGGTARDLYLGRAPYNYNVSVKAPFLDIQTKFKERIVSVNKGEGTITIKYKEKLYILSPFKKIVLKNTYPNYVYTSYIEEDAKSRDFTVNSLFFNPVTDEWVDICNGKSDIDKKIIKFVGDPLEKILESKIRVLRATILPATLGEGWALDFTTQEAIKSYKLRAMAIPPTALNKELLKIFTRCDKPSDVFNTWRKTHLLREIFPELYHTINIDQSQKNTNLDLYQHILYAVDSVSLEQANCLLVRVAALLHDIGKPHTEVYTETGRHFYDHERVGKFLGGTILRRWGFSQSFISKVLILIENHLFNLTASSTQTSIKKLIAKVGPDNIHDLLDLRVADRYGTGKPNISMYKVESLRRKINTILTKISPENFKLDLSDNDIRSILKDTTESGLIERAIPYVKSYLEKKIIVGRLKNKKTNLKKMIKFISKIQCPLDTPHLFQTWADLSIGNADTLEDGRLRCGVYCGFNCDKILKKN